MKIIGKGAEAVIYEDNGDIVKDRLVKGYRIPEIDVKLRGARTRREEKVLLKLGTIGFPSPEPLGIQGTILRMEKIEGKKVKDVLEKGNTVEICRELGRLIRAMHDNGIIHGDLTTSNMIMKMDGKIAFIDFGLSFFSDKDEDKAVDLHLMRQALDSSHYAFAEEGFAAVKEGYGDQVVLKRLETVEQRGRNKGRH